MARPDDLAQLGAALVEMREARGLSQEDVVERVVSDEERRSLPRELRAAGDLDAIERGYQDPSYLTLVDLSRAFDVPVVEILSRLPYQGGSR